MEKTDCFGLHLHVAQVSGHALGCSAPNQSGHLCGEGQHKVTCGATMFVMSYFSSEGWNLGHIYVICYSLYV